jgi:plasmid replication initiation protein
MQKTFPLRDFCESCGIAEGPQIKELISAITHQTVTVLSPDDIEIQGRWFDLWRINHKRASITVVFSQSMKPYLAELARGL